MQECLLHSVSCQKLPLLINMPRRHQNIIAQTVMLRYATLCCAMLCYAMLSHAMPCYATLCCAILCHSVLCCAMLCYATLCNTMQRHAAMFCAVLGITVCKHWACMLPELSVDAGGHDTVDMEGAHRVADVSSMQHCLHQQHPIFLLLHQEWACSAHEAVSPLGQLYTLSKCNALPV